MAMSKIERIEKEIQKTREKITEYQNKLRGLEAQKTEAENLEIVQLVRACIKRRSYAVANSRNGAVLFRRKSGCLGYFFHRWPFCRETAACPAGK